MFCGQPDVSVTSRRDVRLSEGFSFEKGIVIVLSEVADVVNVLQLFQRVLQNTELAVTDVEVGSISGSVFLAVSEASDLDMAVLFGNTQVLQRKPTQQSEEPCNEACVQQRDYHSFLFRAVLVGLQDSPHPNPKSNF